MSIGVDIYRTLGGLEKTVANLEATLKSHAESIDSLTQSVFGIPQLERALAKNTTDLNEVGKRHDKDIHELERRLEKDVNELGRRHDRDLYAFKETDIAPLKNFAYTTKTLGAVLLTIIVPVATAIIIRLIMHIYRAMERLGL